MLIENDSFELGEFKNPDPFFWGGYLWFWNDRLDIGEIYSQLEEMASVGAKSVWIIPVPAEFRPNNMPTNMEPGYLSEEYLRLFEEMTEKIGELGMRLWLYDEGGWPSGGVCGRIVKENPQLIQKTLRRKIYCLSKGESVRVPEDCLAGFLSRGQGPPQKIERGAAFVADMDTVFELYHVEPDNSAPDWRPPFPDLLNADTIDIFIEKTHEAYRRHIGRYFGNVVPLLITDDVKVTPMPWTDDLESCFLDENGYEITDSLPSLFGGSAKKDMQVRIDYFDWWSKRFAENFFGKIHGWCKKNGIAFGGHLGAEEDILGARIQGHGHPLRNYREFDIPGVDAVWRQVYPAKTEKGPIAGDIDDWSDWSGIGDQYVTRNDHFPKFASSVAHQGGKRYSFIELFSVYGSDLTIEQMKWITDYSYVRGINLVSSCEKYLSTKDFYMAAMRPMFFPGNPVWDYLELYHAYCARASYLLGLGTPEIKAALYYPIRDVWAGSPGMLKMVGQSLERVASTLFRNRCDFDFIDDDTLESDATTVENGLLKASQMAYSHVYISKCEWMTEGSIAKLDDFASKGGVVTTVENECFNDCVQPIVGVEPADAPIRACKRKLSNGNLYFLTNEGLEKAKCVLKFREEMPMAILDPEKGGIHAAKGAVYAGGVWEYPIELDFAGSCFVLFSNDQDISGNAEVPAKTGEKHPVLKTLDTGWQYRKTKEYMIGAHDFETKKPDDTAYRPIELGDWSAKIEPSFSGEVEYAVRFECDAGDLDRIGTVDLGLVKYACRAELNGRPLGKRAWSPFSFELKGALAPGENVLKVTVANTMANQYVYTDVGGRYPANLVGGYDAVCKRFEPDSLPSGLYGPVVLF